MQESISLSDWQKNGGAKDYSASDFIGCGPQADEGVAAFYPSMAKVGCGPQADEGVAQA